MMKKKIFLVVFLVTVISGISLKAIAEDRQFSSQATLNDGTRIEITIVADKARGKSTKSISSSIISKITSMDSVIFSSGGLESQINQLKRRESLKLPVDTFKMLEKAVLLSAQTRGWYDLSSPSPKSAFSSRDWRRIILNKSDSSISFKNDGMQLDLSRISKGYYVDIAIGQIENSGYNNAMVSVGPINRNIGRNIFTSWNVQIGFGKGKGSNFAHRAFNYGVSNVASATVTPSELGKSLIDGKNKKIVEPNMRSITILAADAATATAFALATYTIGPKYGMQFVDNQPAVKGVMVDNDGKLFPSTDLNASRLTGSSRNKTSNEKGGGPNDLSLKKREEARDM